VFVFAASLGHLESTPKLYGWSFDLKTEVGTKSGVPCADRDDHGLADAPGVAAISIACTQSVEVDGHPVSALAIQSLRGAISPQIVAGRAPRGPNEIALGSVTLSAVNKDWGNCRRGPGGDCRYRSSVAPKAPTLSSESLQPLADGAPFTVAGLGPILDPGESETHFLLVKAFADIDALERRPERLGIQEHRHPVDTRRLIACGRSTGSRDPRDSADNVRSSRSGTRRYRCGAAAVSSRSSRRSDSTRR
jgi:hypothetical protein